MADQVYVKEQAPVAELLRRRLLADGIRKTQRRQSRSAQGWLTIKERLEHLLDPGSLVEMGMLVHAENPNEADNTYGDGYLYGFGEINGRRVGFRASDPSVKGGSTGEAMWRRERIHRNLTDKGGIPVIYLLEAGGGRISDYLSSRFIGYPAAQLGADHVFPRRSTRLGAILGTSYAPWFFSSLDFNAMTATSHMSVISPYMIEAAMGRVVTDHDLGRAEIHANNGQVDVVLDTEAEVLACLRRVFGYMPANPWSSPPEMQMIGDPEDQSVLDGVMPASPNRAYDVRKVLTVVFDRDSLFEMSKTFAKNLVTGLARLNGRPVAIMANQPMHSAGALDIDALLKARRLMRLCNAMNLPLISFVDVPGLISTPELEQNRLSTYIYEHSFTRLSTDVPKVSVILRKAYGFGLFAMNVGDPEGLCFAWPSAESAFTGPGPAAQILHRKEIADLSNPQRQEFLVHKMAELRKLADISTAARLAYVDDVIRPSQTREKIAAALSYLCSRHDRRHLSDIPR